MKKHASYSKAVWKTILHDPLTLISGIIFLVIVMSCLLAPLVSRQSYLDFHIDNMLAPMSFEHPFGTDAFGRDLFARMLYGGRVTLRITLIAAVVSFLGIPLGLFSGYFGGKADVVLSRIFDALSSLPPLLLIVVCETIFGYGEGNYHYALGIAFMPPLFRLTRTLTLEVTGSQFVDAAKILGVKNRDIILRHVVRNIAPELLTQMISTFSDILLYSTLIGYLNMGVKSPTPEWGLIVHDMFMYVLLKPYLVICPSCVIALSILSINLFGRGLRDAFSLDRRAR